MTVLAAPARSRDWYIDAWRAAALLRVIAFHGTSYTWMTVAFPAMGLMFALAGSLTARSLDRQPAARVVRVRARRLLPPLWVYAVLLVPLTLRTGWGATLADLWDRLHLLFWVAPLQIPPVGGAYPAESVSTVIWYLSLYLWFVLLSPAMLRVFRAWPYWTLAVATVGPVALHLDLVVVFEDLAPVTQSFATYLCCWLLGFAHHDGLLRAVPARAFAAVVAATAIVATVGVLREGVTHADFNLNKYPLVHALWSAVFVAVVLRLDPATRTAARAGPIRRVVAAINARAVTIFLWHFPCVVFAHTQIVVPLSLGERSSRLATVLLGMALTAVPVLLLGWVEDLAARRPARLLPAMPKTAPPQVDPAMPDAVRAPRRRDPWGRATTVVLAALVLATTLTAAWWPTRVSPSGDPAAGRPVALDVTDLRYAAIHNGLGPVERDRGNGGVGADDGDPVELAGIPHARGLGVHAPSAVRLYPARRCSRFTAVVGLDGTLPAGSVVFALIADGRVVYRSEVVRAVADVHTVDIDITGVDRLDLSVTDAGDGKAGDTAVWASPRVTCVRSR